tara:strand:+ start:154 stop:378 length:225 start_codon:yes stop_codon:yes gene_type:complete
MIINKMDAINSLGNWSVALWNEDLSTTKFYNGEDEISKPSDFPSDADINARQADMQTKADTGDYKSVNEIIATY